MPDAGGTIPESRLPFLKQRIEEFGKYPDRKDVAGLFCVVLQELERLDALTRKKPDPAEEARIRMGFRELLREVLSNRGASVTSCELDSLVDRCMKIHAS